MSLYKLDQEENRSKLLLDSFFYGVSNVQPRNIIGNFLKIQNDKIIVKLNSRQKIYSRINKLIIISIGKASVDMTKTISDILRAAKKKIHKGIVVVNKENFKKLKGFECIESGHPTPTKKGLIASMLIEKNLNNLCDQDLIIVCISGGGSALLPYPVNEINLKDKIITNNILLESGANIKEINCVRKHLSKIKGGNFIKMTQPAKVHGLILSDVVDDDLSSIASGLTVPDNTTFSDTIDILKKYKIFKKIPPNVKKYLLKGTQNQKLETPQKTNKIFKNVSNTIIGSNFLCIKKIEEFCKHKNINSKIFFKNVDQDVKKFAKIFVSKIKKAAFKKPILLISGGETTVKIKGKGKGGRNQEFALHFICEMKRQIPNQKFNLLSAGTDGRDGPTNAAGGLVNHDSLNKIIEKKINLKKELNQNNSYNVLKKINSLVIMEGTNTNVADIQLVMIY